jgi:hypothetical protein
VRGWWGAPCWSTSGVRPPVAPSIALEECRGEPLQYPEVRGHWSHTRFQAILGLRMIDLLIRYVEPLDAHVDARIKAAIRAAGKLRVEEEERDRRLLAPDVANRLPSNRDDTDTLLGRAAETSGVDGWAHPPLADETGVCMMHIVVGTDQPRAHIGSMLRAARCGYYISEDRNPGARGYWWTPGAAAETVVRVDRFGLPQPGEEVPDLEQLARTQWATAPDPIANAVKSLWHRIRGASGAMTPPSAEGDG